MTHCNSGMNRLFPYLSLDGIIVIMPDVVMMINAENVGMEYGSEKDILSCIEVLL